MLDSLEPWFPRFLLLPLLALAALVPPGLPQDAPKKLNPRAGCTTKCHTEFTRQKFSHPAVAKKTCTTCHAQPDAKKHEFTEIEDVSEACVACHDLKLKENVHEPVAESDCTDCHDPHSSANKKLLRSAKQKALCLLCHQGVSIAGKKWVHGPVASEKCTTCHRPHSSDEAKLLVGETVEVCVKCHEAHARQLETAENIHGPVESDCTLCHDPHASNNHYQLKSPVRALCLGCHKKLAAELQAVTVPHGKLGGERACVACHKPHYSKREKLFDQSVQGVCATCHSKEIARANAKPVTAVSKQLATATVLHGPIREGKCSACHRPHGGQHAGLLQKAAPESLYVPFAEKSYALCFGCHDKRAFTSEKTKTLTAFRDGERNLHFLHVNRKKGRSCRTCHEMHGGNQASLIAEYVPFGDWQMPIRHEKTRIGGSCAPACHLPKSYERKQE